MAKLFNAKIWGHDEDGYWSKELSKVTEDDFYGYHLRNTPSGMEDYDIWEVNEGA